MSKKKNSRTISVCLAAAAAIVLVLSVLYFGRRTQTRTEPAETAEAVTMLLPTYGYLPDDMELVAQEMNRYLQENEGLNVSFLYADVEDVEETERLLLRAGEEIDLMPCFESEMFMGMIRDDLAAPLSGLLPQYGAGILDAVPERLWEAMEHDGDIYGVPALTEPEESEGAVFRGDVLEAAGVTLPQESPEGIEGLKQVVTPVLEKVHTSDAVLEDGTAAASLQMVPGSNEYGGILSQCRVIDYDGFGSMAGVVLGDDPTVINLFETSAYRELIVLLHAWQEAGYIYQPNELISENPVLVFSGGNALGFFSDTSRAALQRDVENSGHAVVSVPLQQCRLTTRQTQIGAWMIPAASAHKEAAMRVLQRMYTDAAFVRLYDYGIEGVHYEQTGEGISVLSDSYRQSLTWIFGNTSLAFGTGEELAKAYEEAEYSPFYGFIYEPDDAEREERIGAVLNEYVPLLESGLAEDPEAVLDELNIRLYAAGLSEEISSKQGQLDRWIAQAQKSKTEK